MKKAYIVAFVTKQNALKQIVCLADSPDDAIEWAQELNPEFDVLSYAEEITQDCMFEVKRIN